MRKLTMRRLARLDIANPDAVASAHRKAKGVFWGCIAMQRHVDRTTVFHDRDPRIPESAATGLGQVAVIDAVVDSAGRAWSAAPDGWIAAESEWPAHVQWGADQFVETIRHLGGGRPIAAAVTCRAQLERWTINLAHAAGALPDEHESTQEWISRVWRSYPGIVRVVGDDWAYLSELIHGRGFSTENLRLNREAGQAGRRELSQPPSVVALQSEVIDIATTILVQVRGCAASIAEEAERSDWAAIVRHDAPATITSLYADAEVFCRVMDFSFAHGASAASILRAAGEYRSLVRRAASSSTIHILGAGHLAANVMTERRARAIDRFARAARDEKRALGAAYDPEALHARLFRYVAISEAAEIVSSWTNDPEQERALLLAADALRNATQFWLEDTDLSLPTVRVVLEQTCRARAWRLKPTKAAGLAQLGANAGPNRWLEISGWKRASALGVALGEFAHVSLRAKTKGARKLLTELQRDDPLSTIHTARGNALDSAAYLLALEVIERLEHSDDNLAEGFRSEVTLLSDEVHRQQTEDLLQRALKLRSFDLGDPDITLRFEDAD
jgi:hypothetical protein